VEIAIREWLRMQDSEFRRMGYYFLRDD